ncbi:GntR family transcriptional regulator [Nonomuraea thailandensis]
MADPAKRPSAAHTAYAVTKELILSGELPGGSLISEGEIAERVRVSRTPVREAFLRLESEELLALHPKRGAVVVPVPPGEAADVLELRLALERSAAERIARTGLPDEHHERMLELLSRQRASPRPRTSPRSPTRTRRSTAASSRRRATGWPAGSTPRWATGSGG